MTQLAVMGHDEFEEHCWRLWPQLVRHARRELGDADAEDAVSETLTTLWRKQLTRPTSVEDELGLRSLAHRVLAGHVRNALRAQGRRYALAERLRATLDFTAIACEHNAELFHAEVSVAGWLQQLSKEDRKVVLLQMADVGSSEMSRILGCSLAAAAKRRSRARDRLRKIVEEDQCP